MIRDEKRMIEEAIDLIGTECWDPAFVEKHQKAVRRLVRKYEALLRKDRER